MYTVSNNEGYPMTSEEHINIIVVMTDDVLYNNNNITIINSDR